jgi:tyrosine-protein phosphatase YwqE
VIDLHCQLPSGLDDGAQNRPTALMMARAALIRASVGEISIGHAASLQNWRLDSRNQKWRHS